MSILRACPVCSSKSTNSKTFFNENINQSKISSFSFSSRKEPEYMCHRMVQCQNCDLVYADILSDDSELANSYHAADYDSSEEAEDAADSYLKSLRPYLSRLASRNRVLEIGTGTAAFLDRMINEGFDEVIGVEPSLAAIKAAPLYRQKWIKSGMFNESEFEISSFDLICCFMTMEHVGDPKLIAQSSFRLLRPGGALVFVVHDYRSIVNRILGRRSPIVDIEHLQLFSKTSIKYLLQNEKFEGLEVSAFKNTYSISYWLRLTPLPKNLKIAFKKLLGFFGLERKKITINVGNLIAIGFKSTDA